MLSGVNIDTAQNVTINYELASLGDRLAAYFLDWLVLIGYMILVGIFLGLASAGFVFTFIFIVLPFALYHLLCELFLNGQSIGKRARQIKVLKIDGSSPAFFNYLLRWILRPVDSFYGLGLLVVLLNGKGQRLGDLAAGTTVVKIHLRTTLRDTIFAPVEDAYQPVFPEVMRLSDEHIRLINEVLRYNQDATFNFPMLQNMFEKTKAVMKVETILPVIDFLNTVIKDYNYYTQKGR